MSTWIAFTSASVYSNISTGELTTYNNVGLSNSYTTSSLVQEIIDDTIAFIRSKISGCPRNRVDINPILLPRSVFAIAKCIVVYKLMERVVGKIADINDVRKKDYDQAIIDLDKIADGKIGIDLPDQPIQVAQYNQFFGRSAVPIQF